MSYTHTVVGIFESDFDAEDVVDVLIKNGFDRSDIDIRNRWDINGPSSKEEDNEEHKKESGLASFFNTIFGSNKQDAERHYKVAAENGAVVAVYVNSEEEAMRASKILDDNGAINVNDRAGQVSDAASASTGETTQGKHQNPLITKHESEFATSPKPGRLTEEDFKKIKETEGKVSHSRINEWRGETT